MQVQKDAEYSYSLYLRAKSHSSLPALVKGRKEPLGAPACVSSQTVPTQDPLFCPPSAPGPPMNFCTVFLSFSPTTP